MYVCNTAKPFPFIPAASISAVDIVATATATGALGKEKMLEQDSTKHTVLLMQRKDRAIVRSRIAFTMSSFLTA